MLCCVASPVSASRVCVRYHAGDCAWHVLVHRRHAHETRETAYCTVPAYRRAAAPPPRLYLSTLNLSWTLGPSRTRGKCTCRIFYYSTSHGGHEDKNCAFDLHALWAIHGVGSLVLRVVLVWPSSSVARPNRGAHAAQGRDLSRRERRHGPDRPPKHRTASARRRVDRWAST